MDVVRSLADRIIVLHNGQLVADGEPAEVIASPIVQEAYLGIAPERARHERAAHTRRRAHPYRALSHPARRRPRRAARARPRCCSAATAPARPRRCAPSWACGRPRAGEIRFDGERIDAAARRPTSRAPASPMCRRPWRSSPTSRCSENLVLAARDGPLDETRLDWIFGFFPALKQFWLSRAGKLSGGQKQMLVDRPRHRRAAPAAADRRADQGPGAGDHRWR